jgi:hypothetical protein
MPFDLSDVERLSAILARFLPQTVPHAIALTGGIAIQLHCHEAGVADRSRRIADVDFVARSIEAVAIGAAIEAGLVLWSGNCDRSARPASCTGQLAVASRERVFEILRYN